TQYAHTSEVARDGPSVPGSRTLVRSPCGHARSRERRVAPAAESVSTAAALPSDCRSTEASATGVQPSLPPDGRSPAERQRLEGLRLTADARLGRQPLDGARPEEAHHSCGAGE